MLFRGRILELILMFCRALAGRLARKLRQVFADFLNGLNLVVTSVICLVIILHSTMTRVLNRRENVQRFPERG